MDELEMVVSDQKRKAYKKEQDNILQQLRQNLHVADQEEPTKKKKKKKKKDAMMVTHTGNVVKSIKKRCTSNNNNRPTSSLASTVDFVDSVHYEFEWEAIEVGLTTTTTTRSEQQQEEPVVTVASSSDNDDDNDEYVHVHTYKHNDEHEHAPTKYSAREVVLRKILYSCIVIVILLFIIVGVLLVLKRPPDDNDNGDTNTPPPPWIPPEYDFDFAPRTIVMNSGESIIASELEAPMNFVSPSGLYQLSLNQNGDFTIRRNLNDTATIESTESTDTTNNTGTAGRRKLNNDTDNTVIDNWSDVLWKKDGFSDNVYTSIDGIDDNKEIKRTIKLSMQTDGNFVLRDTVEGITVWKSLTMANPDAYFVFDDGGQIKVIDPTSGYPLYLDGIPKSQSFQSSYSEIDDDKTSKNTDIIGGVGVGVGNLGPYPVRGIFYYPWFPTTWSSDDNHLAHYIPKLGQYDSSHYHTIVDHVQQLDYGNIQLGISSWWGPDTKSDKARLLLMMDTSYQVTEGRLKWCVYFEPQDGDDTVEGIRQHLTYLKEWFVDHPSYARTPDGNKPVIFVYNRNKKEFEYDCHTIAKSWSEANANQEWHIVLKLFSGWRDCTDYPPDSWHQYGPSTQFHAQAATDYAPGFVNISPGFWHAKEEIPRLERLTSTEWTESVEKMSALRTGDDDNNNNNKINWHLITSFNEAVEGTIIEATEEWDTKSGMGYFLDALHHN